MKRTLQLFQLLIVVFGFYAALKYPDRYKNIVALSSVVVVGILDQLESYFEKKKEAQARERIRQAVADEADHSQKVLDALVRTKNSLMLTDAVQAFFRELGLPVAPCPAYAAVDRMVSLGEPAMQFGVKVIGEAGDLGKEWEQLDPADGFVKGESGQLRLLLVVQNGIEHPQPGDQQFEKISSQAAKLLVDRHTVAVTTQTLAQVYRLCKEMGQDPKKIFARIYHHPGGLFSV